MINSKIKALLVLSILFFAMSCSEDDGMVMTNSAPTITSQTFSIQEDAPVGYSVGTIIAEDIDQDPLSFSIQSGNTNNTFSIDQESGALSLTVMLDFNTMSTYALAVEVTDGEEVVSANIRVDVIQNQGTLPFQELYDQGIDQYLGVYTPTSTMSSGPGTTEYFFDIPDGPICYTGNDFSMFTRDGSSDELLIFLQGGGFCNPISCEAVEDGIPFVSFGVLSPNDSQNPMNSYNVSYVPYCDGSAMIGDAEVDSDGDGVDDRFFRGAKNLSASLDVIAGKYPSPSKIVLAGNSAGGFAVHHALPLVRLLYPTVPIDIINDSGTGIISPGGWEMNLNYWNGNSFNPSSCTDCIGADGNLTDFHRYQLEQDPNIRLAYISSKQDETFAALTPGGGPAFEAELLNASNELTEAFPDRFQSLIGNGDFHTTIISDFHRQIGGTTVSDWVADMIEENGNWVTVIE